MATFTVWRFDTADGADHALATLERLRKQELITGALTDAGIDDGFIKEVRETVTPGTSALFP